MEPVIQEQVTTLLGNYGWMFIAGMIMLLFRSTIENAVAGLMVFIGSDYDEDDDSYDEESEEEFSATLRVAGNCHSYDEDATITSEFDSETPNAVAGKQVIIKSTVTNTGDVETMYTLSVNGINDWATLASIDDQVFTLAAGENKEVNIILNVDSNAEGDKGFTIKTTYGENKITEHKVSLSISASNTQLTPFVDNVKSNWFIYVIILVNIILIIAIISVIRSMVSPRPL